jgi:hypothetical protein
MLMPIAPALAPRRGWKNLLAVAACVCALTGCQSADKRRRAFVEQFYAEDFRRFHDTYFLVRGLDGDGNRLVGLFCPPAAATEKGNDLLAVLVATPATDSILQLTYTAPRTRCAQVPDSASLVRLARQFLHYRVASLGADTSGGVAVQFRSGQLGPSDLVRVSDTTHLSADFHREFSRVHGPWYERRAAE